MKAQVCLRHNAQATIDQPAAPDPKQQPKKVRELEFTRPTRPKPNKSTFLC